MLGSSTPSFDVELPVDCDDEYWFPADPSQAFRQPPGLPSRISRLIEILKLKLIHLRALRKLVTIVHCAILLHAQSTQFSPTSYSKDPSDALAEVDSDINRWMDETPDHRELLGSHLSCPVSLTV
jgi:hypothetical protein